jgi:hypothetical protein
MTHAQLTPLVVRPSQAQVSRLRGCLGSRATITQAGIILMPLFGTGSLFESLLSDTPSTMTDTNQRRKLIVNEEVSLKQLTRDELDEIGRTRARAAEQKKLDDFDRLIAIEFSARTPMEQSQLMFFYENPLRHGNYEQDVVLRVLQAGYKDLLKNLQEYVTRHVNAEEPAPTEFASELRYLSKTIDKQVEHIQNVLLDIARANSSWF